MKRIFPFVLSIFLASGCIEESIDNIKTVSEVTPMVFGASICGSTDTTKTSISNLSQTWSDQDAISVYTFNNSGVSNAHAKFSIIEGAGTKTALFKGDVNHYGEAKMVAVYPYANYGDDAEALEFEIKNQQYDGDFTSSGSFSDFGKFNYMIALANISETGAKLNNINFRNITGLVRFDITSNLNETVIVRDVAISDPDGNRPFTEHIANMQYNWKSGYFSYSYYSKNSIKVTVAETPGMSISKSDGTKYIQMSVFEPDFGYTSKLDINVSAKVGERRARFVISKSGIGPAKEFSGGKRTCISVPLTQSAINMYASTVKIKTTGKSVTLPKLKGSDIEYGETQWDDGSISTYVPGDTHSYGSGEKTTLVDCWGEVSSVTFDSLENITSIDLSMIDSTK